MGRAKERAEREWWESQGEGKKEGLEKEVRGKGSWDAWVGGVLESVFV